MDIAEKIKFLRHNLNISQDNFAKLLSVSKTTIKNWESSTSKPTTANIMLIANVCHVTVDYLIDILDLLGVDPCHHIFLGWFSFFLYNLWGLAFLLSNLTLYFILEGLKKR